MLDNHALPRHDLFSYTATGRHWVAQEYLSELVTYGLYRVGSFAAVSLAYGALIWTGFWFVLKRAASGG